MCELLGITSSVKLRINPYLVHLREHSHDHPDGWGMAIFEGDQVSINKEPVPAYESRLFGDIVSSPIEAQNAIGHIRLATRGNLVTENCHPFNAEDESGRMWTVAHNGTIFTSEILDAYVECQTGSTDSERILHHILHRSNELSARLGHSPDLNERFQMMDDLILEIVPNNKLNLMVYDGEALYIHTNMEKTLYYKELEDGLVFGTTPIDDEEGWVPMEMMRMKAYVNGREIMSGTKHEWEYKK